MKTLRYIILLTLLLAVSFAEAQNARADSLLAVLKKDLPDSARIKALIDLSVTLQGFDADKAFEHAAKALQLAEKTADKKWIGNAHNNLGDVYWYQSDFAKSSSEYLLALKIFEELGQKDQIATCYRNIGWIYFKGGSISLAYEYYRKSLALNEQLGRKREITQNYNDMAIIDIKNKDFPEAVRKLEKCIEYEKSIGSKEGMIAHYGNLGIAYDDMGLPEKATECIRKSIQIAEQLGNKQHMAIAYCNLGAFYARLKKPLLAKESLEKSLLYARPLGFRDLERDCYSNLAQIWATLGDYDKAYSYRESASLIADTIYNNNNTRQVNEMTAKYESEKKELQIRSLQKAESLATAQLESDRLLRLGLIGFCVLAVITAFLLYRGNLQKKKSNETLTEANKELEEKNRDITDSINYSQRIQEAILPSANIKSDVIEEAGILFRPKEVVSGDFYWYTQREGQLLVAACDCTGHGVPGALMSMIAINMLSEIVSESESWQPSEILGTLQAKFREALKQDENASTDGMDIALFRIDTGGKLVFAGANRPLLVLRKGRIKVLNGDERPIGGNNKQTDFSEIHEQLENGDHVFAFSDGLPDQLSSISQANGTAILHGLLAAGSSIIETHKNICSLLDQGKVSQCDDILMIGIRV